MTKVEIRKAVGDEMDIAFEMSFYAFYASPGSREFQSYWAEISKDCEVLVLYEDDKPVASATSIPMHQNVRGKMFKMSGISNVTTNPEVRRRGYATQLMQRLHKHAEENGDVFATLYPFRESFYGRFGYVTFPQEKTAKFAADTLLPLLKTELPGRVERLTVNDAFDDFSSFLQSFRAVTHGMSKHPLVMTERRRQDTKHWIAVAKNSDGKTVGICIYRITGFKKPLIARHFLYKDSLGKYLLLQWFARHVDQVDEIVLPLRADERVENWAFDLRAKLSTQEWPPTPMGRVMDVVGMGGMNVGPGSFRAEIKDEEVPKNNGIFEFKSENGKLVVSHAEEADCTLTIHGLSSLVFCGGGAQDFEYRNWGNPSKQLQQTMETMFPLAFPFLYEMF